MCVYVCILIYVFMYIAIDMIGGEQFQSMTLLKTEKQCKS